MSDTREHRPPPEPKQRSIGEELQTWQAEDLIPALACVRPDTWLAELIRNELRNRGLGHKGEWVGYEQASRIWRAP